MSIVEIRTYSKFIPVLRKTTFFRWGILPGEG